MNNILNVSQTIIFALCVSGVSIVAMLIGFHRIDDPQEDVRTRQKKRNWSLPCPSSNIHMFWCLQTLERGSLKGSMEIWSPASGGQFFWTSVCCSCDLWRRYHWSTNVVTVSKHLGLQLSKRFQFTDVLSISEIEITFLYEFVWYLELCSFIRCILLFQSWRSSHEYWKQSLLNNALFY